MNKLLFAIPFSLLISCSQVDSSEDKTVSETPIETEEVEGVNEAPIKVDNFNFFYKGSIDGKYKITMHRMCVSTLRNGLICSVK